MGFGGPIALIVVGLILALAFDAQQVGPLEVTTLGWILVLAGVVWLVLTLVQQNTRRRHTTTATTTDAEGRRVHGEVRFEPEVITLQPGEQTLVQIAVEVTRGLRRGVDYRGEVSVPGLTGTRIPLVVRRVAAPRSRAKASG